MSEAQTMEQIFKVKGDKTSLPNAGEGTWEPFVHDADLYIEVRDYGEKHMDFVEDIEYDLFALKTIETWYYVKLRYLSYPYFIGPVSSGKTKALETGAALAFNPIAAAYMSPPIIYRLLDEQRATLFLDEVQQYLADDRLAFMSLLNSGYRKGQKAWIMVSGTKGWEPQGFDVFSPKWLASTQNTVPSLRSRCIMFPMSKNVRRINREVDLEWGAQIKPKINKWVAGNFPRKLDDVEELFEQYGIRDLRTQERFQAPIALCPPLYRKPLMEYIREVDQDLRETEELEFYGELADAILWAWDKGTGLATGKRKIWIRDIAEAFNDGKTEGTRQSNQQIGYAVSNMGLQTKCSDAKGTGRKVSLRYINRLRKRYHPDQPPTTLGEFTQ